MKYYAIADIHGRYDLLNRALDKIAEVANPEEDKIITLGDYIDRGPDSNKVIQCLLNFQHFDGIEMICLQGNHEAMMVESITAPLHPDWWIGNGGDATLKSYGWGGEPYFQMSYEVVPKEHIDWLRDLPLWYETEKQIFVLTSLLRTKGSLRRCSGCFILRTRLVDGRASMSSMDIINTLTDRVSTCQKRLAGVQT
jgi:hypothetical protein